MTNQKKELDLYFEYRCRKGMEWRGLAGKEEYEKRLEHELDVICSMDFAGYFLIVCDLLDWCRKNDIPTGTGRGCVNPDTPILLSSGEYKLIKDIRVGDQVFSHTGTPRKVQYTHTYPIDEDLVSIHTYMSGQEERLVLTADHKCFAQKQRLTEQYKRHQYDKLRNKVRKYICPNPSIVEEIEAQCLQEGDWILIPKLSINEQDLPRQIDLSHFISTTSQVLDREICEYIPQYKEYPYSNKEIHRITGISRNAIQELQEWLYYHHFTLDNRRRENTIKTVWQYVRQKFVCLEEWAQYVEENKTTEKRHKRYIDLDDEFLWILGKWIADGWWNKNNDIVWGICFCKSKEQHQIDRVRKWLDRFDLSYTLFPHKDKDLIQLEVRSYCFLKWWKSLFPFYQCKSQTKHLPSFAFKLPKQRLTILLQGLIDGDGSLEPERWTLCTTSRKLAYQTRACMLRLGNLSSILVDDRRDKRKEYQNSGKSYYVKGPRSRNTKQQRRWYENDYGWWVQIKSIDKVVSNKYVYDLTIEADSSYLTFSGAIHNSAGGSLATFCLNITQLDPLRYGLIFERFLDYTRTDSYPDIDLDFGELERHLVFNHIVEKFGADCVCGIGTYGKMKTKGAIRAMCRTLGYPYDMGDELAKLVLPPVAGKEQKLEVCYEKVPELTAAKKGDSGPERKAILEAAEWMEGRLQTFGTHASGLVISDFPVSECVPLGRGKDNSPVAQVDMNDLEEVGLIKFDILGLRALSTIKKCLDIIEERHGEKLNPLDFPVDDPETYDLMCSGDVLGVFQLTCSQGFQSLTTQIQPRNIDDGSMLVAIYRPGPMSMGLHQQIIDVRNGVSEPEYFLPELEPILKDTAGLVVFQEQLMAIGKDLAGYDAAATNRLRKCLHKDTIMITPNGYETIEDLYHNIHVNPIKTKDNRNRYKKVSLLTITDFEHKYNQARIIYKGKEPLISIITESGTQLLTTLDHRILTQYGYVEAKDLTNKHYLLHCRKEHYGTIQPDDNILFLFAALITEGYLPKKQTQGWTFTNSDQYYILRFITAYREVFGEEPAWATDPTSGVSTCQIKKKEREHLLSLGITTGLSGEKKLPKWCLCLDKQSLQKLLSWMVDFDGEVSFTRDCYLKYTTKSIALIKQMKLLFECFGLRAPISKKYNKKYNRYYYEIVISDTRDLEVALSNLPYSRKVNQQRHKIHKLKLKQQQYTKHVVPYIKWKPVIEHLIKASGHKRNRLIGHIYNTGRYFKETDVSVEVADKLLRACGRNKELEFYLSREVFWDKVQETKDGGWGKVYDFSMETGVSPCGYANNLLVHNSTAKKKKKMMDEQHEKFVSGMVANGFQQNKAEELFQSLVDFSSYSFNRSHSSLYFYISFQTAYLKAHYPLEYICACLISEGDEPEEIYKYLSWCQKHNIRILPPDINQSQETFSISKDGKGIHFGLGVIKNVSVVKMKGVVEARDKDGPFRDIFDFCDRYPDINRRMLVSLIQAGAFDSLHSNRQSVIDGVEDIWRYRTDIKAYQRKLRTYEEKTEKWRERERQKAAGAKLPSLKKPEQPSKPKAPVLMESLYVPPLIEQYEVEMDLLGYYLSGHPVELVADRPNRVVSSIEEMKEHAKDGDKVSVLAVPAIITETTTRKTKQKMAYITVEDGTDTLDITVFAKTWAKHKSKIKKGRPAVFVINLEVLSSKKEDDTDDTIGDRVVKGKAFTVNEVQLKADPNSRRGAPEFNTSIDFLYKKRRQLKKLTKEGEMEVKLRITTKTGTDIIFTTKTNNPPLFQRLFI